MFFSVDFDYLATIRANSARFLRVIEDVDGIVHKCTGDCDVPVWLCI